MNRSVRTLMFWFLIVVSAALFWQVVRSNPADRQSPEVDYSTFISQAQAGQIASVRITGARIDGEYRDGKGRFWLTGPSNSTVFLGVLQDKGVEIRFREVQTENLPLQCLARGRRCCYWESCGSGWFEPCANAARPAQAEETSTLPIGNR
jgi:ATP-dependent Zn protease